LPRLDFYADFELFVKLKLEERDVVVGRGDDCTVQLPDERVSRRHAVIRREADGSYVIEDRSRNGTRVNATMLETPRRLEPGDRIYIERFVIIFQPDDQPPEDLSELTTHFEG
jgi:pSer/pThr/pTyr-binding forkhead associated (FHA) protein